MSYVYIIHSWGYDSWSCWQIILGLSKSKWSADRTFWFWIGEPYLKTTKRFSLVQELTVTHMALNQDTTKKWRNSRSLHLESVLLIIIIIIIIIIIKSWPEWSWNHQTTSNISCHINYQPSLTCWQESLTLQVLVPRLVVMAMAQLKRDHPELALTATDEAWLDFLGGDLLLNTQLQSGQWEKVFEGSVKGLVIQSTYLHPESPNFQISESVPGFRNGKMILEWGSSPKLVL